MALVRTFPSDQTARARFRKVETGLTVTYSRKTISGSWGWSNGLNGGGSFSSMIEYHRYARKRYRYVGMTDAAKDACIQAMNALYTRKTWTNYWQSNGTWSYDQECGDVPLASVTPVANDDGSWDVEIDVNEDDVRYSLVGRKVDAKYMFPNSYEKARDYDGETEADLNQGAS